MSTASRSQELAFSPTSAWPMVFGLPLTLIGAWTAAAMTQRVPLIVLAALLSAVTFVCLFGFFVVTPNHSKLLVLFGSYRGTVRTPGFYWTNPFTTKATVSLRAHNVASDKITVNDFLDPPFPFPSFLFCPVPTTAQSLFVFSTP